MPIVPLNIKHLSFNALLDSGASSNFCNEVIAQEICRCNLGTIKKIFSVVRLPNTDTLSITEELHTVIKIANFTWKQHFFIIPSLSFPFILGYASLKKMHCYLDFVNNQLRFNYDSQCKIPFLKFSELCYPSVSSITECPLQLTNDQRRHLEDLLSEYNNTVTTRLGKVENYAYRILLIDPTPIHQSPYPLTPPKAAIMRSHIQKLLDLQVIEPSLSPYSSPCFLVPKKDGGQRLVVDYRRVNQRVRYDAFPVPRPDSMFQCLKGATIFTKLDLNMAYHQLPLTEDSKPITAFATSFGSYQYRFLPFGLAVSAAALNRIINSIFGDLHFKFVTNYFDDLLIYSKNFEEHLDHLRQVFERLRNSGFTVNPEKTHLCMTRVKCLGYVIDSQGCHIDPEKIEAIQCLPIPKNLKQVKSFLGMTAYFARFIERFSEIAAPLNQLKRKNVRFHMDTEQIDAINKLKNALSVAPVLKFPDFNRSFIVRCDSSDVALGAVLLQEFEDGIHPVAYASRKLSDTEKRYQILEREALGVIFALDKFHDYLQIQKFILQVDNEALTWMIRHPKQLGKVGRWVLKLSHYCFDVQHIKGQMNSVADALSRMYDEEPEKRKEIYPPNNALNFLHEVPESFLSVKNHQESDPETNLILQRIRNGEDVKGFVQRDGTLMKLVGKNRWKRVVAPEKVRRMILYYFHDLDAGHPGITKTYRAISRRFWWPNLFQEVRNYVRSCEPCQQVKPSNQRIGAPMASTMPVRPFDKVYVDYCGPIIPSSSGNRYVLVLLDSYTKWIEVIPCRRATASVTCKNLIKIWCSYGPPRALVSDNATVFRSKIMKRMSLAWGIQQVFTSPYQPSSNMVERSMRDLKASLSIMLRTQAENNHKDWDKFLPFFALSHNTNESEVTHQNPARLFLGREITNALDRQWGLDRLVNEVRSADPEKVQRSIQAAHQKVKRLYDLRRPSRHDFSLGQLVLQRQHVIANPSRQEGQKFMSAWSSPRRIVRFTTPVSCILEDINDPELQYRTHISQLKPYHVRIEAA